MFFFFQNFFPLGCNCIPLRVLITFLLFLLQYLSVFSNSSASVGATCSCFCCLSCLKFVVAFLCLLTPTQSRLLMSLHSDELTGGRRQIWRFCPMSQQPNKLKTSISVLRHGWQCFLFSGFLRKENAVPLQPLQFTSKAASILLMRQHLIN